MESRRPDDNLERFVTWLYVQSKNNCLRDLQSLIRLLNIPCWVVSPGRDFFRRIIDLTCNVKKSHHFIKLTDDARKDIQAWQAFIENSIGKAIFLDYWVPANILNMYADALGSIGYVAVLGSKMVCI